MVLVVNDQTPYKTLKELVDDAKKRPDEIIFSSSGLYGALHLPTALFMNAAGIKMRHLPTQGGGPALTALLGNNSQVLVSSVAACLAQIKAGKARPLALFGAKRSKALPDVPTMKEPGYDVEFYLWVGMFAPKGTPGQRHRPICARLEQGGRSDQFKMAIANLGQELAYMDQPEFATFWDGRCQARRSCGALDRQGRGVSPPRDELCQPSARVSAFRRRGNRFAAEACQRREAGQLLGLTRPSNAKARWGGGNGEIA